MNLISSDSERESNLGYADHRRENIPQIISLDEKRRPQRNLIPARDSQDAPSLQHQNIPRQPERILPSVEGQFRSMNYHQRALNEITQPSSHSGSEASIFSPSGRQVPRTINAYDQIETYTTQRPRGDDMSILSIDNLQQSPRDYHQERACFFSRDLDNVSGPHWNHGVSLHRSVSDSFPAEHSMLVSPTSVRIHSGRQRPSQSPSNYRGPAIKHSYAKYEEQVRPKDPKLVQVPLVPANSVAQRQVFLNPAHELVDISQSFPTLHRSPKKLIVLHGSSKRFGTAHQDGFQNSNDGSNQGEPNNLNASAARLDEHIRRTRPESASQSILREDRQHYVKDQQRGFDVIPKSYKSPVKVQDDVQTYERQRTGILLRKLSDGRYAVHDDEELIFGEPPLSPYERQFGQHPKPGSAYEQFDGRQTEAPLQEIFRTNRMNPMARSDDRRWYVLNRNL